jgi:ribonuclease P protein component
MKVVNRIKANEDFALAIKTGRSFRADSFVLHFRKNELTHTRVGVSVSKKLGNAVTRNHIKRQIRCMCDALIDYSNSSLDIVVVARRPYLDRTYQENSDILKLYLSQII